MEREITIDATGRVVIPKKIRDHHHLDAGSRLIVLEEAERIVLVPRHQDPQIVEKGGLLVVTGTRTEEIPDHRALRDQRLDRVASTG